MNKGKLVIFYAALAIPMVLLCVLVGSLSLRLHAISSIKVDDIVIPTTPDTCERTPEYQKHAPRVMTRINARHPGAEKNVSKHFVIGVFGASSLVIPQSETAFPQKLEESLQNVRVDGRPIRVLNFGHVGMVSQTVCSMAMEALERYPINLMMLYTGHNDYNSVFRLIFDNHFHPFPTWVDGLTRTLMPDDADVISNSRHHIRNVRDPAAAEWLLGLGVMQIDNTLNRRADQEVNTRILKVLKTIADNTANNRIPLVLIPPVSNLEIPPISADGVGEKAFADALLAEDPEERFKSLIIARDEDTFSGSIRTKSTLRDTFRKLTGGHLCHIDLEKRLHDAGFAFDEKNFLDAVHFTPDGHLGVAAALDSALQEMNFCLNDLPEPKTQPLPASPPQPLYMP